MTPLDDMPTDEAEHCPEGPLAAGSIRFAGESFGVVEQFVKYLADRGSPVDWGTIRSAAQGSGSLEQEIDRAALVADQMARGVFVRATPEAAPAQPRGSRGSIAWPAIIRRPPFAATVALSLAFFLVVAALAATNFGGSSPTAYKAPWHAAVSGNAQLLKNSAAVSLAAQASTAPPPVATSPPAPAPPSLSDAPPLRPHEVFGFAPYWTLAQSGGFNVAGISTIAYFSIGVNGDGSLAESGPGWAGYESQSLATLITRAHGAGDRVVLTVNCFGQSALDQLTSSPTAPTTLSTALIGAIQAKNLDGVNLDFEGTGASDQAGLTNLVSHVSAAVHAVNPHYQVTMDTYGSAAGDTNGFYNVRALAPAIDGFFVMQYDLNLASGPSAESPLTSTMFSDQTTINQYAAAVPPAKVILGLPYFGVDWPTSDGTLSAQGTGPATDLSDGQIHAGGHPVYWDATTGTAWTSYQVGAQWHETFFEDPTSLYDAAKLAGASNLGGVGIWALGMDGNDPAMLSALLGFSPAVKDGAAGPAVTSQSPLTSTSTSTSVATTTSTDGTGTSTNPPTNGPSTTSTSSTSTTTSGPITSVTTTTVPGQLPVYQYTGNWRGHTVVLHPVSPATWSKYTTGGSAGLLSQFASNDPADMCLSGELGLYVVPIEGSNNRYLIVVHPPNDCVTAAFTFTDP
jgi:hypothetical protein